MKLGVAVKPPETALFSVTVNVNESPSVATASASVTPVGRSTSSSVIVPVAVPVSVTANDVPETLRPTVNVSSDSLAASSVVATTKVCSSPLVPWNVSAAVFSV